MLASNGCQLPPLLKDGSSFVAHPVGLDHGLFKVRAAPSIVVFDDILLTIAVCFAY